MTYLSIFDNSFPMYQENSDSIQARMTVWQTRKSDFKEPRDTQTMDLDVG